MPIFEYSKDVEVGKAQRERNYPAHALGMSV